MLDIKKLNINIGEKNVLNDINLNIKNGENHVIIGPNGAGKSSLANSIIGYEDYKIKSGEIIFKGKLINDLKIDERALLGIFLAFQNPKEISGLEIESFLYEIYKNKEKCLNNKPLPIFNFRIMLDEMMDFLEINKNFKERYLNVNFSGGEKKKMEILQMLILKPDLAILDESDSGLDIDAIKILIKGIEKIKKESNQKMATLIITHNLDILNLIKIDKIHILKDKKIIKSGGIDIAKEVLNNGYKLI